MIRCFNWINLKFRRLAWTKIKLQHWIEYWSKLKVVIYNLTFFFRVNLFYLLYCIQCFFFFFLIINFSCTEYYGLDLGPIKLIMNMTYVYFLHMSSSWWVNMYRHPNESSATRSWTKTLSILLFYPTYLF